MAAVPPELAFNTAVSFVTNTNWQNYGGETTMSHLTQMAGLTVQNFVSAATGIAVAVALIRGFARVSARKIGNFWVDLTRITLFVLLPICVVFALVLIFLGMPQTLAGSVEATTLEGASQTIATGPVASQVAIKMLGTNGGGFFNVNAAHRSRTRPRSRTSCRWSRSSCSAPRSPTSSAAWSATSARAGRSSPRWASSSSPASASPTGPRRTATRSIQALGIDGANMEGKEVRFGPALAALFAVMTTAASCGAVNAMHDSFMPLGGLIPLINMQLGEIIFGGVGAGLYGMLIFVLVAIFIAGLMVGRTPEYVGKKIEAREVKLAMLAILSLPLAMLGFTASPWCLPKAVASIANPGPHGFSEVLYAYTSAAANNGSAFGGLTGNTPWYNMTLGIAMLTGRFLIIVPALAIAGSLAAKKTVPASAGSFPTHGGLFVGLLVGVILIVGGLTFFPALALGPVVEHLAMLAGQTF